MFGRHPRVAAAAAAITLVALCVAAAYLLTAVEESVPPPRLGPSGAPMTAQVKVPEGGYNVILIVVDSLRYDHLNTYGYQPATSPNIDKFAQNAIVFEELISQCSWTLPSHATMLLGQNPSAHGVDHNFERIREDAITLPHVLQQAGFKTRGMSHAPLLEKSYGIDRGFDVYDDTLSTQRKWKSWRVITNDGMMRRAVTALDQVQQDPFMMFMHLWDVHYDYNPRHPFDDLFDPTYTGHLKTFHWVYNDRVRRRISPRDKQHVISLYDGEIAWTDHYLGRFFQILEERGLMDNTVVILTADHGEEFFDHGLTCHNHSNYDELVHVPFIVHVPGLHEQVRVPCRTAMVDLFPTVLEFADVPPPDDVELQGRSLLELIRDETTCDPDRPILTETVWSKHDVSLKTKKGYEIGMYRGDYMISRRLSKPTSDWLFDLSLDPGQLTNLAEEEPELFEHLSEIMHQQAVENARIHGETGQSRHKKMDRKVMDTLQSLGYVD